jgi:hypothetical protein
MRLFHLSAHRYQKVEGRKPLVRREHNAGKAYALFVFRIIDIHEVHMAEVNSNDQKSQLDKFKDAARELECDDDDQRFKERLGKLVKVKPEKPE